jgi:hypothetical protein
MQHKINGVHVYSKKYILDFLLSIIFIVMYAVHDINHLKVKLKKI